MMKIRAGLWCLVVAACTDKGGTDSGTNTDSGSGGASFTAQEGTWVLAAASIAQDECEVGDSITSSGEENFLVEVSETGLDLTFDFGSTLGERPAGYNTADVVITARYSF